MIIWERSVALTLPVAVFFLTLDRCLMLYFGLLYRRLFSKLLCVVCTTVAILVSCTNLYIHISQRLNPTVNTTVPTDSLGFDFFRQADDWQFLVRVAFGTVNFVCSLVFFALLRREHAKQAFFTTNTTHKTAGNKFVLYAVCSELLLNFLPHAAVLVFELIAQKNISQHFGQYSREFTSIDALACAIMYRQV
ncbi:hypothetical protein AAVH_27897 [Aphelenchoides avenae]|nr:hypothetical protein AAVH_27897 [Aphelenchus avenae]